MSTTDTPPSAPPDATRLAQLLKAAGDELRLQILRVMAKDSFGVLELSRLFDTRQSGMSHHLKVLAGAKLVTTRKEGNSVFYRRMPANSEDDLATIRNGIFKASDQLALDEKAKANLQEIYRRRAAASQNFFAENVEQFKKHQDLIAAFEVYAGHVEDTLHNASPPSREVALEVGPGTGEFLAILCQRFTHITALDNSPAMLAAAQKNCARQALANIDFVLNDTRYCRAIENSVDCAVINMVLHHTPSPQQIFDDVARALKPGGVLIICDLCQHDQDWTREACGDLWLGFAPEDLTRWAAFNALREGQGGYFALRNGFQIQIREFIK